MRPGGPLAGESSAWSWMLTGRFLLSSFSPEEGANVNRQGRKALVIESIHLLSPEGATVHSQGR